jgi:hypothetical protein
MFFYLQMMQLQMMAIAMPLAMMSNTIEMCGMKSAKPAPKKPYDDFEGILPKGGQGS